MGTITLTANALAAGANWNGYTVGEGIYIQGTDTNGNGATFTPNSNGYYVIGAISGATITLTQGLTAENNATVGLSPVTINANGGTFNAGAPNPYYTIGASTARAHHEAGDDVHTRCRGDRQSLTGRDQCDTESEHPCRR